MTDGGGNSLGGSRGLVNGGGYGGGGSGDLSRQCLGLCTCGGRDAGHSRRRRRACRHGRLRRFGLWSVGSREQKGEEGEESECRLEHTGGRLVVWVKFVNVVDGLGRMMDERGILGEGERLL